MGKSCLIVVDYQVDFVSGSLGFKGAEAFDDEIVEKIREYRENGGDVIFTLDTHTKDYLKTYEGKHLPVKHCIAGRKGHRLFGMVAAEVMGDDIVIEKNSFGSSRLLGVLAKKNYDIVELCGLVSNICVISNAIIAKTALPEAEIIVDSSLTASSDSDLHNKALDVMKGLQIVVK